MDLLLQHQQSLIRQLQKGDPMIDVEDLFDEVIVFLNNSANDRNDSLHILTVVCYELAGLAVRKSFNDPKIINHPFFSILCHTFSMLLTKVTFLPLTKEEEQCFDGISVLISALCLYKNQICTCFYTDNNAKLDPDNKDKFELLSYEKIFFTESLINKLIRILNRDIVQNEYEPYDIRYKILDRFLHVFYKLNYMNHPKILESVLECVESDIYLNLYKTTRFVQSILTPKQSFFMYQCPKFLSRCQHTQSDTISSSCKKILKRSDVIFERHLPIVFNKERNYEGEDQELKTRAVAWYMELLNHFALLPTARVCFIEGGYSEKVMIDQAISILNTKSLIQSVHEHGEFFHADVALMSYSITLLYNLTFERKIFCELQEKKILSSESDDPPQEKSVRDLCEQLYTAKDRTIQFAAQTLYAVLKKEDIDQIVDPGQVARSYLYLIENTLDDWSLMYHGIKLDGVLTNLEDIVQNDSVKEEITNDGDGIAIVARCVYQPNLDFDTIQYRALRIIDAISFANQSAVQQIKDNDLLMEYIRTLLDKSPQQCTPIVDRIFWKVREEEYILKQDNSKKRTSPNTRRAFDENEAIYQYIRGDHRFQFTEHNPIDKFDIMISYCEDERELAGKIRKRLTESGYQVSFDEKNEHSTDPEKMARAVEQSTIVIICFSSKYRKSYACRLEAEYTKRRHRVIVPVKMERSYDPTGWLTKVIENGKCVDFTNFEFNNACEQLIDQINEKYRKMNED